MSSVRNLVVSMLWLMIVARLLTIDVFIMMTASFITMVTSFTMMVIYALLMISITGEGMIFLATIPI